MEPPPGWNHYDTGFHSLEVYDEIPQPLPELEAAAAAAATAVGEDLFGAGALGPMDAENHEGASSGSQEPGQQHKEPGPAIAGGPQPGVQKRQPRPARIKFTPPQVEELERVFQRTQYPTVSTRKDLARRVNVDETKVQVWFKNRRAKWKRQERASVPKNTAALGLQPQIVIMLDKK